MGQLCYQGGPVIERQSFDNLGILQITIGHKKYYGIGVFVYPHFITLTRYFARGATLKVKILNDGRTSGIVQLPLNANYSFLEYQVVERVLTKEIQFGTGQILMKLTLRSSPEQQPSRYNNVTHRIPSLLRDRAQVKKCKGFAIGLSKNLQSMVISAQNFYQGHISTIKLEYSAALIFIKTQKSVYLYGIYDNVNEFGGEDYHLSSQEDIIYQATIGLMLQNEAQSLGSIQSQVAGACNIHPYSSTGLLQISIENKKIVGTATVLFDKNKRAYKYLITCAHNFYYYCGVTHSIKDYTTYLASYSFRLLSNEILQQPGRCIANKKQQQFKIKNVYIPKEYIDATKGMLTNSNIIKEDADFQLTGINKFLKYQFIDIAIVQLVAEIKISNGFHLNLFQKPFNFVEKQNIQVTGFPNDLQFDRIYEKQYTSSTRDHYLYGRSLVQISRCHNTGGKRIIRHQLSTLPGNSGSPIYEKRQNDNDLYLFGIHTGAGGKSIKQIKNFIKQLPQTQQQPQQLFYGQKEVSFKEYNRGTYLYSDAIYSWLLSLPGIHTVTDHYEKLISHIAILELADNGLLKFGIGFLSNQKWVQCSSSYSQIQRILIKKCENIRKQENVLTFDLSKQEQFITIAGNGYQNNPEANIFGLRGLQLESIMQHQLFVTKNIRQISTTDRQNIEYSQALGLKVGLKQAEKNKPLQLFIKPFKQKDILQVQGNQQNVFLFVYDFTEKVLIWSKK